jgi:hypothetical protein
MWRRTWKSDPAALEIADRHYSRQKPGTKQFTQNCRNLVLIRPNAVWVTAFPKAEHVKHAWAGAWMNSFFRNEGDELSSELIRAAVAITRAECGFEPPLGMLTFVDPKHVRPTKVRGETLYGYCYLKAGFKHVGFSKTKKLWAWQMLPEDMPAPMSALEYIL